MASGHLCIIFGEMSISMLCPILSWVICPLVNELHLFLRILPPPRLHSLQTDTAEEGGPSLPIAPAHRRSCVLRAPVSDAAVGAGPYHCWHQGACGW